MHTKINYSLSILFAFVILLNATCQSTRNTLAIAHDKQQTERSKLTKRLIATKPGTFQILVKDTTGAMKVIDNVTPKRSVAWLQQQLYDKTGLKPSLQKLSFQNTTLTNTTATLADYNITPDAMLDLGCALKGGSDNGGIKFQFTTIKNGRILKFGKGPRWWRVGKGLNLEGKCSNYNCPSRKAGQKVWVHIGDKEGEVISIGKTRGQLSCPQCDYRLIPSTVTTCGFYRCSFRYRGMLESNINGVPESGKGTADSYNGMLYFDGSSKDWWNALEFKVNLL